MKLYIAGPMRGYPDFNAAAFEAAEELLRDAGHQPFNPARQDIPYDAPYERFMAAALRYIVTEAEGIILLCGWQNSVGACMEARVARTIGLPCYEFMLWNLDGRFEEVALPPFLFTPATGLFGTWLSQGQADAQIRRSPSAFVPAD